MNELEIGVALVCWYLLLPAGYLASCRLACLIAERLNVTGAALGRVEAILGVAFTVMLVGTTVMIMEGASL